MQTDSKVEEPKTTILDEDLEIYFSLHWGPPSPTRIGMYIFCKYKSTS